MTLEQFAENFRQEIGSLASSDEQSNFKENIFMQQMILVLEEIAELDEGEACYHYKSGAKINGYGLSHGETCLDLFTAIYRGSEAPERVGKADVETALRRARVFLQKAGEGLHASLEESSPAFSMAERIYRLLKAGALTQVRIFLLSDGIIQTDSLADVLADTQVAGLPVSFRVWDIERMFRLESIERERIRIDFSERGGALPYLAMPEKNETYTTYLAIIPASMLVEIYHDFGSRLLEANVRSFLQVRGKVNPGIQVTLHKQPHMFLAYNNGLAATASEVEFGTSADGQPVIKAISDLQIVNGGQTTASLYHAARKSKFDVSGAFVQMKLSVVHDDERFDEFVSAIAKYANSQNKVSEADFFANDPFHRKIEELSRTVWAPSPDGVALPTRWFYERARGQYGDARSREGDTKARQKKFDITNPRRQMFTKTDLAKYEATWNGFPHMVSRGAQKNFNDHVARTKSRTGYDPNESYFHCLVAKAIIFREAEKLIGKQGYGGYRSQIVAYTLALLAYTVDGRVDLDRIWREQEISSVLQDFIVAISVKVFKHITNPAQRQNIAEWCKKEACWAACQKLTITVPAAMKKELITWPAAEARDKAGLVARQADAEKVAMIRSVEGATWTRLSEWAKENDYLSPGQRQTALSMGRFVSQGKPLNEKQANTALTLMDEAEALGFKRESVEVVD
jgi:hypothetical protein